MPAELCSDCGQTKYNKIRKTSCDKCRGTYRGYYISSTAKTCSGSNCNGGAKKSDPNKDCDECKGTGKKLTRCEQPGCINGNIEYSCLDDFHN
ncbi:hypothetical protein BU26DRAFT_176501 [Trematosphaeria pertusa]|uniref:Uncharacterized protein n=1 Tax=Trematosphaeria pertusa TaxID=390896 RepID=A0A6A6HTU4_9PLEO|nr:uncharacterized protein BU26DRAFT_176501 [Trematosphaeria pertusa]KAF2241339.1 hypothetical protein BU26DRAFT_176501 [Trematosphaeria pertusa]